MTTIQNTMPQYEQAADPDWKSIYQIGAGAALLVALAALIDILSTLLPGGYVVTGSVIDWFNLFQTNPLMGLRDLGLLDIIVTTLNVPLFYALAAAPRRVSFTHAALAAVLACVGTAIFLANCAALPMLALSREYASAMAEPQRAALMSAGQSLLASGAHSSPGTFMAYLFTDTAGILMGFVFLRSRIFSKFAGWAGILGFTSLLIFNICAAFIPAIYDAALVFAGIGGLLFIGCYALTAGRLFQLGRETAGA
ncbi:MAG: DUF4386 family protein [Anaerolineaceae bacterium]|nr:DUF4386 family protein [Anaerolineaceae bacterium]